MSDLGKTLARFRRLQGFSQAEVAKRMDVTQSTVSQLENETLDPRLSTLRRYALAVDARFEYTITPVEPPEEEKKES